jgi:cell division initiation protein
MDVRHQEFTRHLTGGYNRREVKEFLDSAANMLEEFIRENTSLKEELLARDRQIEELRQGEQDLKRAVVGAERIGKELKANAEREAQLMIREAEATRDRMVRDALQKVRDINQELDKLGNDRALFISQFKALLRAYSSALEDVETRIKNDQQGAARERVTR